MPLADKHGCRWKPVLFGAQTLEASPICRCRRRPTKYEFVINLETAKALGITILAHSEPVGPAYFGTTRVARTIGERSCVRCESIELSLPPTVRVPSRFTVNADVPSLQMWTKFCYRAPGCRAYRIEAPSLFSLGYASTAGRSGARVYTAQPVLSAPTGAASARAISSFPPRSSGGACVRWP